MKTGAARFFFPLAICLGAFATPANAQFAGTDANIDPAPIVQNEVSLTVIPSAQPGQPQVLVAAYNDNPYPSGNGLGVSYSTDGGASWPSNVQLPFPTSTISGAQLADAFDPTITVDTQGRLFVGHISTDGVLGGVSGLYVRRSTDGGASWSTEVEVSGDSASALPGPPDPNYRFNDRCQITTDPNTDNVYIAWIKDRGWYAPGPALPSDIFFSRSTDNGQTFSTPIQVNDAGQNLSNMPIPRVAANGTVLVSWLDYDVFLGGQGTVWLDKSTDGGQTWGTDQKVATISLPPLSVTTGFGISDAQAKGAPVLATSPTNASELYLVYAADPDGAGADEADIFFIRSTDQGMTWNTSSPLRLNTDATKSDQILPWMDVKANGSIDVAWYDRQNDLNDQLWDVYVATSTDGGNSFQPEVRLNDQSFPTPVGGTWMGEYLGLVVDSGFAYVAWTSSFGEPNGDIYFDKIADAALVPPLCGSTPATGCRVAAAGKALLLIKDNSNDARDLFKWVWNKGAATTVADFKDPVNGTATYRVCVYDSSGVAQPLVEMNVPPGGTCGPKSKPCWKATRTTGYRYSDTAATSDGMRTVRLKAGLAGKAKVLIKGKGANLLKPALPLSMPVTVQVLIDDAVTTECWQTTYTGTAIKNDGQKFKAKGP